MFNRTLTAALLAFALATTAAQAGAGKTGTFTGENRHTVSGGVSIIPHNGGFAVRLESDFYLDGAPDPKVGFGKGGRYVDDTLIGLLKANTGKQIFPIPASMDISGFDTIFIWCEKFSVSLGKAALK